MRYNEDPRRTWHVHPDEESFELEVVLTDEGVVINAYAYGVHQDTDARTAEEWFEWLLPKCGRCHRGLLDDGDPDNPWIDITGGDICEDDKMHYVGEDYE